MSQRRWCHIQKLKREKVELDSLAQARWESDESDMTSIRQTKDSVDTVLRANSKRESNRSEVVVVSKHW